MMVLVDESSRCENMARTGKTFGGAPSKSANTCTDIRGTEDIYTALVNVPGVNDLEMNLFELSTIKILVIIKWLPKLNSIS